MHVYAERFAKYCAWNRSRTHPIPAWNLPDWPPSAVNSQPWHFTHEGDTIHVNCSKKGRRLDTGIALAYLHVAHEETF